MKQQEYTRIMNASLRGLLTDALKLAIIKPSLINKIIRILERQKEAEIIRQELLEENISVPPYMILSLTGRCNLRCKGCYAMERKSVGADEMSMERIRDIIGEAYGLGISVCMLAGGEPLVRKEILDITADYPDMIFPLFTNGTMLDDDITIKFKNQRNVVPVISMEGYVEDTDKRRGEGVYLKLASAMTHLKKNGIFYGTSLTVTRSNFDTITNDSFVRGLIQSGCKLFFFVDYVPVKEGTENWVLLEEQREKLMEIIKGLRIKFPGLFIAFPGDEEQFGGCMSAGRGFVHISPQGDLEPCPFAPYSDVNLKSKSLKEALKSSLLSEIRQNHSQLLETAGGCALWEKREWLGTIVSKHIIK